MPAMSLSVVPCNHRWTDNMLVPEVPELYRPEILRDLGIAQVRARGEARADCTKEDLVRFGSCVFAWYVDDNDEVLSEINVG